MKRIIVLSFVFAGIFCSCRYFGGERIHGNGNIKNEERKVGPFTAVNVSGSMNVYVTQDSSYSVKIEADENLMEYIDIHVDGERLYVEPEHGFNLDPSGKIKVFVSAPTVDRFKASGACDIYSQSKITSNNPIVINISGAGKAEMEVQAPEVNVGLSGAGTIKLRGQTKDFIVEGSGSSDIQCFDLMTENARIRISGAGDAEVFASVSLDARISGAGGVKYRGNPTVKQNVSGAGSIRKVD